MSESKEQAPGSFSGAAPSEPLPPMAERIASAKEQARAAREAAGLPPVDDGPFSEEALRARKKRRKR